MSTKESDTPMKSWFQSHKDVWTNIAFVAGAAFLSVWGLPAIEGTLAGKQPVDVGLIRSAVVAAGGAAVVALFGYYSLWANSKPKVP